MSGRAFVLGGPGLNRSACLRAAVGEGGLIPLLQGPSAYEGNLFKNGAVGGLLNGSGNGLIPAD